MYFPSELWTEIKDYAGIHSMSTNWTFPYIYDGNWLQFYLEWVQPTAEQLDQISHPDDIKRALFKHSFTRKQWTQIHFLNKIHTHASKQIYPILRSCNALLEVDPSFFSQDNPYDLIEFYIPFYVSEKKELELLQSIHTLLVRFELTHLFYCYQPGSMILTVNL
jgi:hypothetical protein